MDGLVFCNSENDGVMVYPEYLNKDQRMALREKLAGNKHCLRCSCRDDEYLYYYVSADLRFVPAEQFYEHKEGCARGIHRGPYAADEEGCVRVQLKFNPLTFTTPKIASNATDEDPLSDVVPEDEDSDESDFLKDSRPVRKKNPLVRPLDLSQFVQKLTYDAFNDRQLSGKPILSTDYFNTHLYSRCKKVCVGGMKKSLRDLSLKEDRTAFLFGKLTSLKEGRNGAVYAYVTDTFGKTRSFFIFSKTLEKEKVSFYNQYGRTLDDALLRNTVMVAGFCYKKFNRFGREFTVLGRACFYLESGGIFLFSDSDSETFSLLVSYCRDTRLDFYFLLPPAETIPYIKVCFKGLSCYGHIYFDRALQPPSCPFVELKRKALTTDVLNELIHEIKK